jgi:hypothetical protein
MKWAKKEIETIKSFLNEGKSINYISKIFSTTEENLRMIMSRHKIRVENKSSRVPCKLARTKKENNIAVRLAVLQGLIPAQDIKKDVFFNDEQLKSWIGHPEVFIEKLLNIQLQDFQKDVFNLFISYKRVAIAGGRGVSKSFLASLWLIYSSIIKPNQRSLIVSPSDRQSKLIFEQIQKFIASNEELFNSVNLKKSNAEKIMFENNSEIIPLPCSAYIRGYQNVSLVLMDECAFFPDDEMIFSAIMPMLNIRNEKTGKYGSLILLSSPNGTNNKFFEFFYNPQFKTMKIPSCMNKYLDKEKLEEDRLLMSPVQYESEYLCEFCENISNFFNAELIKKITQNYDMLNFAIPKKFYFLGWDTASSGRDSSVLTVIELDNNRMRVVNIIELQKQNLIQQIKTFETLNERFKFRKVCIESAGFGEALSDSLKEKGIHVLNLKPTIDEKAKAFTHLLRKMENDDLVIPNHPKLQSQLRLFRYELSKTGKLMLHHSTEQAGDDFVDSLCFAVWCCSQSRPLIINTRTPQTIKNPYTETLQEKITRLRAEKGKKSILT